MNYQKIYNQLIEHRLQNPLPADQYGENHHIIPRSLGGSDNPDNIIRLSAREHFVAHALLSEMYEAETLEWYKMNHAFMMMKLDGEYQERYVGSRFYELKRSDFSKVMAWAQKGKRNSQYGTCWIKHMELEESKKISKEELQEWLDKGWEKGRCQNFKAYKEKQKPKKKPHPYYWNNKKVSHNRITSAKSVFGVNLKLDFETNMRRIENFLKEEYIKNKKSTLFFENAGMGTTDSILSWLKFFDIPVRSVEEAKDNYIKNQHSRSKLRTWEP